MQETLTAILPDCERHLPYIYRPLHDINDTLHQALPTCLQAQALVIYKSKILDTVDTNGLNNIANNNFLNSDQAGISVLARVRLLNTLVNDELIAAYRDLKIKPLQIKKDGLNLKDKEYMSRYVRKQVLAHLVINNYLKKENNITI